MFQWYRRDGFRIPGSRKRVNTEGHRVFSPLVRSMEAAFLPPHGVPLLTSDWLEFSHMAMPTLREAENHLLLPEANSGAKMLGKGETWVLVPLWAALGTPPGSVCLWGPGRKRECRGGSRWGRAVSEQNPHGQDPVRKMSWRGKRRTWREFPCVEGLLRVGISSFSPTCHSDPVTPFPR